MEGWIGSDAVAWQALMDPFVARADELFADALGPLKVPRHPLLLEASFDGPGLMMSWVKKPLLGREGANILWHQPGKEVETTGDYGEEGYVFQQMGPVKAFDGRYAVIGSWAIGHEEGNVAGGMGVRESESPITTNTSQFLPHLFG